MVIHRAAIFSLFGLETSATDPHPLPASPNLFDSTGEFSSVGWRTDGGSYILLASPPCSRFTTTGFCLCAVHKSPASGLACFQLSTSTSECSALRLKRWLVIERGSERLKTTYVLVLKRNVRERYSVAHHFIQNDVYGLLFSFICVLVWHQSCRVHLGVY